MISRIFRCAMLMAFMSGVGLYSDGFKFKDGRLDEEQVMELQLTPAQMNQVDHHFKPGMVIRLTKSQRTKIKAKTSVKIAPTKIEIYKPADLQNECSCFLYNLGLLFKPGWIELPTFRVCSDQEAVANQAVD